ncbi:DUF4124 domain-containing protein [Thermomonas aquatica]|uniref:DUF4124 domain-containing protein n=1 Tax=Thermomonas aquatica TaxID=2202149 RepID=A0A5B7ZQ77_9GAMM|nr:DUF4124 domain-containing protein [Thermomonas aquatica]QDA56919.1 DUF4124 domain-containing protein [Thermomonas aquatica]
MRQFGMLLVAVALGAAAWWWFSSEMPRRERERAVAAEAAARQAERANSLYRWRDAAGNLQITEDPPKGRKYERISRTPQDGIQVSGDRD